MTSKTFTWNIDDPGMLHQIMTANVDQKFEGPKCEFLNLEFVFEIIPNAEIKVEIDTASTDGTSTKTEVTEYEYWVNIGFKLKSLPSNIDRVILCIRKYSKQLKSSFTDIGVYSQENLNEHSQQVHVLYDQMRNMNMINSLDIHAWVHVIKIFVQNPKVSNDICNYNVNMMNSNYPKQQRIVWNIDHDKLQLFKKAAIGQCYESDIMNDMWLLCCYPKGEKKKYQEIQKMDIFLILCNLPPNVEKLRIKCEILCIELDFEFNDEYIWDADESSAGCRIGNVDFERHSALTFESNICIIEEFKTNDVESMEICDEFQIRNVLLNAETKHTVNDANDWDDDENDESSHESVVILNKNIETAALTNSIAKYTTKNDRCYRKKDKYEDVYYRKRSKKRINYLELDSYMVKIDHVSLHKLSTAQLMQRLKSHKLPFNGLKHELIDRWRTYQLSKKL